MPYLPRNQSAGPLIGFSEQVFSNSQINRGRIGINVPEKSGEMDEPTIGIDSLAIPTKKRSYGERTPEIMKSGTGDTWRNIEPQLVDDIVKCDADNSFADMPCFR
jgi:hypothetical protein